VFIIFSLILISLVGLILFYTSPRGLATSIQESDYKYRVAGWLEELARVIRSFKFSKGSFLNMRKTDQLVAGYLDARTAHFRVLKLQYWTLIGFKVLITASMLIVGSILLINQQLNLGQFVAAEIVILLVLGSVEKLILHLDKVYDVLTSVEKLGKITDQPVDDDGKISFPDRHQGVNIQVQGLSFDYDKVPVLKNISFTVEPGQKVAVMGADGSGKSTLLRVISGAYNEFQGGILIDNIPIRNYQADSLRLKTGILLSTQDIFEGSVLDNITMGDNNIRPEEVMRLSEKVGLKDFLEGQPEGFETELDPVGKRLSRSVMQKILLLRALVNDPRLLLLEEPWTGFEQNMRNQVKNYLLAQADCTVLVATNDADFASKCDLVLYLSDGMLTRIDGNNSVNGN
jgi:ABC-type bacteriocin/lantibiotic exporter with double-glycine peptidase domain